MVLQVNSSCTAGSKEKDTLCGTYCYQVVKPLLQFADSVKSNTKQFTELQDKIKEQAAIISSLNDRIELIRSSGRRQSRVSGEETTGYEYTQRLSDSENERVL
ncbi:hypothetical protein ACLKA6_007012 [Drosophila palustris]